MDNNKALEMKLVTNNIKPEKPEPVEDHDDLIALTATRAEESISFDKYLINED